MEIETSSNSNILSIPTNRKDVKKLEKKSQNGDSESSLMLAFYYFQIEKTINSKVLEYVDLAIKQGQFFWLPLFLSSVFALGFDDGNIHIEKSEDLEFKYSLKQKSLFEFSSVISKALNSEERQRLIIEDGKNGNLHDVYNKLVSELSNILQNDYIKVFIYLQEISNIFSFFDSERRARLAKPISLGDERRMAHYTNIKAIHSMLRLPEDLNNIESYKKTYPVLRLYNAAYMNDPEEGLYLFDCEELNEIMQYIDGERCFYTYLASLSTHKSDDLTMWRLYGRDGTGVSIILPQKDYQSVIPSFLDIFRDSFHSVFNDIDANGNNILLYEIDYECNEIKKRVSEKTI